MGATAARPLLELQQRFVDLRFGMFVHFNMAIFQYREWGDQPSAPSLFHPTALDTDQWAAAAQCAQMTWGCLTTRHHDGFCLWPMHERYECLARFAKSEADGDQSGDQSPIPALIDNISGN
jgi:alpha-L-fucosidase